MSDFEQGAGSHGPPRVDEHKIWLMVWFHPHNEYDALGNHPAPSSRSIVAAALTALALVVLGALSFELIAWLLVPALLAALVASVAIAIRLL